MKKEKKLIIVLRDAYGNPYKVNICENDYVDIDICGGNMVMVEPKRFDTNVDDASKQFKYDGGMEFIATPSCVAKFNEFTDSYDAQDFIHNLVKK